MSCHHHEEQSVYFRCHENDDTRDSRGILCCGVGSPLKNLFSVGREIMDKYFMYRCMEPSNTSCNAYRITASMSGLVETMKRHNETMKCHNETTKRQNDKRRRTDLVSDESNS